LINAAYAGVVDWSLDTRRWSYEGSCPSRESQRLAVPQNGEFWLCIDPTGHLMGMHVMRVTSVLSVHSRVSCLVIEFGVSPRHFSALTSLLSSCPVRVKENQRLSSTSRETNLPVVKHKAVETKRKLVRRRLAKHRPRRQRRRKLSRLVRQLWSNPSDLVNHRLPCLLACIPMCALMSWIHRQASVFLHCFRLELVFP